MPGTPDDPLALIDSRDLARFALSGAHGTFDVPGPANRDTRADLMAACAVATGADATFVYVDEDWLVDQGVEHWTELPLWIPASVGPGVFASYGEAPPRPPECGGDRWSRPWPTPGRGSVRSRTAGARPIGHRAWHRLGRRTPGGWRARQ